MFSAVFDICSNSPDVKGDFARDSVGTKNRVKRVAKSVCTEWHREHGDKIVFDKCRGWALHALELREIFPDSKIIVTLRNLPDVLASFEKHHEKTSIFHEQKMATGRTLMKRYETMFSDQGMIGKCLLGIQETILRPGIEVFYFKFEEFCLNPKAVMNKLYCYLMEEEFEHDFENVENVATDPDYLYFNKFPHQGEGKVEPPKSMAPEFLHPEVIKNIMASNPWYHETFEYK